MKNKITMNDKPQAEINTVLVAVTPDSNLSTDAIALDGAVVSRGNGIGATSETYLIDCIVGMKHYPDKYFDLAVVDPPYGIGEHGGKIRHGGKSKKKGFKVKSYKAKSWDVKPSSDYFTELFRVSKNQIIWGGNYFIENLRSTSCFIIWDKKGTDKSDFADCEIAWTSFDTSIRKFKFDWIGFGNLNLPEKRNRFHPTQKPIALYKWLLKNYAKEGDKILDTHLGSGSNRIASHELGFAFTSFELDEEYFFAQDNRFKEYQSQLTIFTK